MFNTPFKTPSVKKENTWWVVFKVLVQSGQSRMHVIIWLNDNFEDIYDSHQNEEKVYEEIFDEFGIVYKKENKKTEETPKEEPKDEI